ncbi:MAG: RelA/SpoT domain-containing protein [Verrucomicrobiota bacterium]
MKLTKAENKLVEDLVAHYAENQTKLKTFLLDQINPVLVNSTQLGEYVHSFKWRLKEPSHLRDKLKRKIKECKEKKKKFRITPNNLFFEINDLVGIRILHLHTRQIAKIDKILRELFEEGRFRIIEGPFARTWDDETKSFFDEIGIRTRQSGPSMYTSVHYVIDSNSRTRYTAEIQVRTLAEELWGEVAHTIDYPTPSKSLACKEQIRVLARVTSSCTRLVDSIFRSHEEFNSSKKKNKPVA